MKILQCGYGHIGKVLFLNEFLPISQAVKGALSVYDPNVEDCPSKVTDLSEEYDFAFICVPTNKKDDGSADISIVLDLCKQIKSKIIIIKSTIPLEIIKELPANAVFSPEFTGTTPHKGHHNYLVLGGDRNLCNAVSELYKYIHDGSFKFYFCDIKTAIVSKYAENCFLAAKVTFFNEIAQACKKCGIEYEDVRNIVTADERISPDHTFVYADHPFYDSHCLNKDIPAFNAQFDLPFMKAVEKINLEMKQNFKSED